MQIVMFVFLFLILVSFFGLIHLGRDLLASSFVANTNNVLSASKAGPGWDFSQNPSYWSIKHAILTDDPQEQDSDRYVPANHNARSFDGLVWRNKFHDGLDTTFYSLVEPTPLPNPYLVSFNTEAAREVLGLDIDLSDATQVRQIINYFSGNAKLNGSKPLAMVYAGHQFGHFTPRLGDGRAVLLGEVEVSSSADGTGFVNNDNNNNNYNNQQGGAPSPAPIQTRTRRCEIQLKGSGPTPYSRGGDGLAVLRSTIREYLGSEAMHALGIPTTRALAIVGSDDKRAWRETVETVAMMARLAPSHIRFGSFEYFYYRKEYALLRRLADHTIEHHFPHLNSSSSSSSSSTTTTTTANNKYARLLREVVLSTARLIAKLQSIGFAHGVLNTDNMSILGLTIDYGPFGFLEEYDPEHICNHSDGEGRYAFNKQPSIGMWNLERLGEALSPLIMSELEKRDALQQYWPEYERHYNELMRAKLGLRTHTPGGEDERLVAQLLHLMARHRVDYTIFFRQLSTFDPTTITMLMKGTDDSTVACDDRIVTNTGVLSLFRHPSCGVIEWFSAYAKRLAKENGNDDALTDYKNDNDNDNGSSRGSQSQSHNSSRKKRMDAVNPKFILRNYMAQEAISNAQMMRDYSEIERLLRLLRRPFFDEQDPSMQRYAEEAPEWGKHIVVGCSS